jgi:hypothetical protein
MTNIDAVGAPAPPPPPPCQNPKVELDVEKTLLTLKHDCACRLTIEVTPASCPVTEYKIEIQKASGGSWFPLSAMRNYAWVARVAGKFKLRGTAKVNGSDVQSALKDVEVQFPSYDQIVGDSGVRNATNAEWRATIRDCTEKPVNRRRERGFFIRVNTKKNRYTFTNHVNGPWVGPGDGASLPLGSRPPDDPSNPAPNAKGSKYVVASFHTHTSTAFRTVGRPVGPSGADDRNNTRRKIPGVVYDYTAASATGGALGSIPAGHPKNSGAKLYKSLGLERRPTP